MRLLRNEWEVKKIDLSTAKEFICANHYSGGAGNTAVSCFGLYYKRDSSTLHGVSLWMPPPLGASKSVTENHSSVISLSRFCLVKERPENSGSFLISQSMKSLDSRWKHCLTYADTFEEHDGGLYRASNWNYKGMTKKRPVWWDEENKKMVSQKRADKWFNKSKMLELGYKHLGNFKKHKFVFQLVERKNIQINSRASDELIFRADGKILKSGT
tara:strand:+ start:991 stop:1632 length:642 start_codon:yes stop_codon:yes gene_type:complete